MLLAACPDAAKPERIRVVSGFRGTPLRGASAANQAGWLKRCTLLITVRQRDCRERGRPALSRHAAARSPGGSARDNSQR